MSITITITDPTPAQIAALFGTLDNAKPERKPAAKKADEPKVEETQPDVQDEKSGDSVPSLDDVKAAAQALVGANGREALAELLEKLGAKNLSTIAEGDRAKFIEQAKV